MAPIGIAILGSGIYAQEEHKPAVLACADLELKAIYSRSQASAAGLAGDTAGVDLYAEDAAPLSQLLARDDIAAVIVALPILVQPGVIRAALAAGKHVLSEKPIAENTGAARELVAWKAAHAAAPLWAVAENFRFQERWAAARGEVAKLGRITGFSVNVSTLVEPGAKYFETAWRKAPQHQGGFLLDGGVHFVAGLEIMLGGGGADRLQRVAAFTSCARAWLKPVDTVRAVWRTAGGVVGSYQNSFGTTHKDSEWRVETEGGTVTVGGDGKLTVRPVDGEEVVTVFDHEVSGVKPEVRAFAQAIRDGRPNELQSPEKALRDLVLLESMLKSGERDGEPIVIED